ncbi:YceI family protein [Telmatocola sphagniphila]|uniref:YceI family protein n=1 Tax=Telmatocola sphagniphila TaxID=1123043 RepID=A0A8E6B941_9BACT|nr:YceI family protein [Telmatocola sphagniphila]QVL32808.1 YceI family protein [Telmatocola sphagniphila]
MIRNLFGLVLLAAIGAFQVSAADTKFELSGKNTEIKFVGTKKDGKHEGGFKTLIGSIEVEGKDIVKGKITVEIDMDSTWSDNEKLTNHLKAPDFFGVKNNPKSKFVSTKIEPTTAGYNITGDLTLNGKTKSIVIPAKVTVADDNLTLKSEFKINKLDFGMAYGKGIIEDEVSLTLDVKAKK